jgi:TonB family protein
MTINIFSITAILILSITAFGQNIKPNDTSTDTTSKNITNKSNLIGGRSKADIMKVVMKYLPELRYAYNKRLQDKPGLKGKIYVKFSMNEFGTIIHCKIDSSTIKDDLLENNLIEVINKWQFDKTDKRGDVTEVVYPFVFESGETSINLGGRSKASIMKVVMKYLPELRYAYNKRLRDKSGLKGKIYVKFAIDEFGTIILCKIDSSTVHDDILENNVTDKIKNWHFDNIDKPGDVTEVMYPFVFSQGSTSNKFGITVFSLLITLCVLLPIMILTQK